MEPSTELRGRLLEMKQRFVRTVPERIAAITATLADFRNGGTEATHRLEREFHTLAGTAGTFDLHAVAAVASEGEGACAELHQSLPDGEDFTYLAFLVEQLHGALAVDAPGPWSGGSALNIDSQFAGVPAA